MSRVYLADQLWALKADLKKLPGGLSSEMVDFFHEAKDTAESLKSKELFSFTKKALLAASDLRIDTPDRLERVLSALTREPRSIFIEAETHEILTILGDLRGFLGLSHLEKSLPKGRIGFSITIDEAHVITVKIIRFLYDLNFTEHESARRLKEASKSLPSAWKEIFRKRSQIIFEDIEIVIDPSKHTGLSKSEFERLFSSVRSGDFILEQLQDQILGHSPRDTAHLIDDAWRMARLKDITLVSQKRDHQAMGDFLTAASYLTPLHVISLLAVIQAEAREIVFEARSHEGPHQKAGKVQDIETKRPQKPQYMRPDIRIVSLNIDMPDDAYPSSAGRSSSPQGEKARHAVRGHLFLARNGKLVWRKAHWRGSLDVLSIHRVTAR